MRKAADILKLLLSHEEAETAERYHSFFTGWRRVAGEKIAAHTTVRDIRDGVLVVEVDHPGWIQMIQMQQEQILDQIRRAYPALGIRGLRLQLPWQTAADENEAARRRQASPGKIARTPEEPAAPVMPGDTDPSGAKQPPEGARRETAPPEPPVSAEIRGALDKLKAAIDERKSKA